jgi:hypothetical protein
MAAAALLAIPVLNPLAASSHKNEGISLFPRILVTIPSK